VDDDYFSALEVSAPKTTGLGIMFIFSGLSILLPLFGVIDGGRVLSLLGYTSVIFLTIPLALGFRLKCWRIKADNDLEVYRLPVKVVPFLQIIAVGLAIGCAFRFAVTVA